MVVMMMSSLWLLLLSTISVHHQIEGLRLSRNRKLSLVGVPHAAGMMASAPEQGQGGHG